MKIAPAEQESDFWISFSLQSDGKTLGQKAPSTRVDGDEETATEYPNESKINSICVYLTDPADKKIVAAGYTSDASRITEGTDGKTNVVVSLWPSVERGKPYNLYVAANTPDLYGKILSYTILKKADTGSDALLYEFKAPTRYTASPAVGVGEIADLPTAGMPMSSEYYASDDDIPTINIPDDSKKYDTPEDAYPTSLTVNLVRLLGRLDFKAKAGDATNDIPANFYPMEENRYAIEVVAISPVNLASNINLRQRISDSGLIESPAQTLICPIKGNNVTASSTGARCTITSFPYDKFTRIDYLGEYFSTTSDWSKLKMNETTGVIITGLLRTKPDTEDTPGTPATSSVAKYLAKDATEHPDIYYFDDKVYQGEPQANLPANYDPATNKKWHTLKYDAQLGGYPVHYIMAIRHLSDTGSEGVVAEGEYGIARNTVYQMSIEKIFKLPTPWKDTDSPEDPNRTISLKISFPTQWTYHRQVIDFEN